MAKSNSKSKRKLIGLVSEESGQRTYYTKINTMNRTTKGQGKLELNKYDPKLRKHVKYVETKQNLGRNVVKEQKH